MQGLWVLLGLAIFVVGWLLSGHFPPWPAFQQQWAAALGVALVGLGAAMKRSPQWRWPLPALLLLVLAAVPIIQRAVGQIVFLSDAVLASLYIGAFGLSVATGANLASNEPQRWTDALMIALLVAALASTGLALIQWLRVELPSIPLDPLAPGGRPYANLAQANHLATLLGLGIAAAIYLFERQRLGWPVTTLACAWFGWGLLMTQSRTGWLFIACLVGWWAVGRRRLRSKGVALAIGCLLFIIGVAAWSSINEGLMLPAPQSLGDRADTGLRSHLLRAMLEAIGNSPWVGWGWNQVSFAHLSVAVDHDAGQRAFQNAHSIVLDLPLWMGIPLAAILLAATGHWLARRARACHDSSQWSLLLAVGAIGVHAVTEYPLDYSYFLLTLGLLVGTLEGLSPTYRSFSMPAATFLGPWALCTVMLFWIGADYMKVEESARQVRMALAGIAREKATDVPLPETLLLDAPREYHRLWITPAHPGMTVEQLAWMRDVTWRNPSSVAMLRYAMAAGLNGQFEESERTLRAICNIHPPKRCEEARESWRAAQVTHYQLRAVLPP